jgi:hypothetical protein
MNEQLRRAVQVAQQLPDAAQNVIATRILEEIKEQERDTIIAHHLSLNDLLYEKRKAILRIAAEYGASNIRILGPEAVSDIDFLVDLEPGRSLLDLGGLLMDLQNLLGPEVGVVTEPGLHSRIPEDAVRENALREAIPL